MTIETVEDRQGRYLATLRETGSHVRARAAAGVGARAVGKWRESETFAEAEVEAAEYALDTVVQASREAALAGDSAQQTNWLKIARPELRPQSAVNVGVALGGAADPQLARLDDAALVERARRALFDAELRGETIDAPARLLPAAPQPAGAPIEAGEGVGSPSSPGRAAEPLLRPEDLL